ncbi:MAG TPA: LysM peptidoglycan-binding domain-containing protein [Bacteroidales bacterium]|nr:LysM peptidoglycan-binding domain-containing protein [Bacteroidales bacterium]HPS18152.1 LysM peptidoglycan-binding domain-containing protein [Bacteroidales bacterium]
MKLRYLFIVFGLLLNTTIFAQVKISTVIEKINGKDYYIHTVAKGESVWKIAKAYGVTSEQIVADNPYAKKKIKPTQKLRIPVNQNSAQQITTRVDTIPKDTVKVVKENITHTVKQGETLYGIAKKYSVTVNEIKKANPGLSEKIVPDQVLKIPSGKTAKATKATTVADNNTAVTNTNTANHNTTAQTQKQDTIKTDNDDKLDCDKSKLLNSYNIALMIPFYLDYVSEIDIDDPDIKEKSVDDYKSFSFVQFYEGALMAIDSLKKSGLNVKVYVYDVQNDSLATKKLLEKPEFQKIHLIIGPFFEKSLKVVSDFSRKNKVYVVDPVSTNDSLLYNNPYLINANIPVKMQLKQLASYIVGRYPGMPVIVVHNNKDSEKEYVAILKNAIHAEEKKTGVKDSSFREVVYSKSGISGITKNFKANDTNVVVTLSSGEVFLTNYVRGMSTVANDNKMIVFGLPSWKNYDQIETEYFMQMYLHMFSSTFIDYQDEQVIQFVKAYREAYKTEPDKYAFLGFDVTAYFLKALMQFGTNFGKCLDKIPSENYLQTGFKFVRENKKDGIQNAFLNIYRYEDYQLVDVRKHPKIKEKEKKKEKNK